MTMELYQVSLNITDSRSCSSLYFHVKVNVFADTEENATKLARQRLEEDGRLKKTVNT